MTDTTDAQIAKELAEELHDATDLIDRQAKLLTGVANALKGPPGELSMHDHSDLPEVARKAATAVEASRQAESSAQRALGRYSALAWESLRALCGPDHRQHVYDLPRLIAEALGRAPEPEPIVPRPGHPGAVPKAVGVGEDGRWCLAYGHHESRDFLPAVIAANHGNNGYPELILEYADDARDLVEHRWAVEGPVSIAEGDDTDWPGAPQAGEMCVHWEGITEQATGAFPVTVIDLEMLG